jgi:hypothetical protein
MKHAPLFISRVAIGLLVCSMAAIAQESSYDTQTPYAVLDDGTWQLRIHCASVDTPQELIRGMLLRDGHPVRPKAVGDIVITKLPGDINRLRFYGNVGQTRGWYFADSALRCQDLPRDDERDR